MTKQYTQPIRVKPIHVIAEMTEIPVVPDLPEIESEIKDKEIPKQTTNKAVIDLPEQNNELDDSLELKNEFENRIATEQDITEKPVFVCGGDFSVFRQWFAENFKLNTRLFIAKGGSEVIVRFRVNTKGFVDSVSFLNATDPLLAANIKSTLLQSPRWASCNYNGKVIPQVYLLPLKLVRQFDD